MSIPATSMDVVPNETRIQDQERLGWLFAALCLISAGAFLLLQLWPHGDDAYIFYTYARNIALGNGYVFQAGEHVNATTSPLYTLLLALTSFALSPFFDIDGRFPASGQLLESFGLLAAAWYGYRAFCACGLRHAGFLFPLILFSNGLLAAGVGLETFVLLGFLCAAVDAYVRGRYARFSLLSSLAVLTRPDALLFVGIFGIDYLFRKRSFPPLRCGLIFLGPLVVWIAFSWAYFGSPVPTTLLAKQAQAAGRWSGTPIFLQHVDDRLSLFAGRATGWLAIVGILLCVLRGRFLVRNPVVMPLVAWALLYFCVYGFIIKPTPHPWYYVPPIIAFCALLAFAGSTLVSFLPASRRSLANGSLGLAICLISLSRTPSLTAFARTAQDTLTRAPVGLKNSVYLDAIKWLNETAAVGSTVSSAEIGMLGYYYRNGRIIDALGLVTPGAEDALTNSDFSWYVKRFRPDYIILKNPPRPRIEEFAKAAWFSEDYAPVYRTRTKNTFRVRIYKRRASGAGQSATDPTEVNVPPEEENTAADDGQNDF